MNTFKKILSNRKCFISLFSLVLVISLMLSVNVTMSFLKETSTSHPKNTFAYSTLDVEVTENFDDKIHKKNVNATNKGNTPAYIRIQLTSYRVNDDGDRIGGTAKIPEFTPGEGWLDFGDGLYVYNNRVAAGSSPVAPLIGSEGIELKKYTDDDGGRQVVEVTAECIDASNVSNVQSAWNVNIDASGKIVKL